MGDDGKSAAPMTAAIPSFAKVTRIIQVFEGTETANIPTHTRLYWPSHEIRNSPTHRGNVGRTFDPCPWHQPIDGYT